MSANNIKHLAVDRLYLFPGEHDGEVTLLWGDDPAPGEGITEFEEEFLAHIVLPNSNTVGRWMLPQVKSAYDSGNMPPLLPAPGDV